MSEKKEADTGTSADAMVDLGERIVDGNGYPTWIALFLLIIGIALAMFAEFGHILMNLVAEGSEPMSGTSKVIFLVMGSVLFLLGLCLTVFAMKDWQWRGGAARKGREKEKNEQIILLQRDLQQLRATRADDRLRIKWEDWKVSAKISMDEVRDIVNGIAEHCKEIGALKGENITSDSPYFWAKLYQFESCGTQLHPIACSKGTPANRERTHSLRINEMGAGLFLRKIFDAIDQGESNVEVEWYEREELLSYVPDDLKMSKSAPCAQSTWLAPVWAWDCNGSRKLVEHLHADGDNGKFLIGILEFNSAIEVLAGDKIDKDERIIKSSKMLGRTLTQLASKGEDSVDNLEDCFVRRIDRTRTRDATTVIWPYRDPSELDEDEDVRSALEKDGNPA